MTTNHDTPWRTVLSLYTGAGGLDLGLEAAGFCPVLCVEVDDDARKTLVLNRPKWPLSQPGDIHKIGPREIMRQASLRPRQLTLLSAGPPCQPFSKSGYWSNGDAPRLSDPRAQTLSAYVDVVEVLLPRVVILENVMGLTYDGKQEGMQLLESGFKKINRTKRTNYIPRTVMLNAAHYGVPQHRERVFIVASIDGNDFIPPQPTHGDERDREPYLTAWDAIGDLDNEEWPDELAPTGKWAKLLPSIPEGHNYLWHTPRNAQLGGVPLFGWRTRYWSFLLKLSKSRPSWTIQAAPGPATGPFHWRSRRLSIEELLKLQTFPRGFNLSGSVRSMQRQVGNAVPSAIGELLGLEIRRQILKEDARCSLRLVPDRKPRCPSPEPLLPVPTEYMRLRPSCDDHPGTGLGPSARLRHAAAISLKVKR